ncbi:MAG TPA: BatD family protein [Methanothrix sp.]|nr:BatD family protein [Methanothrix sp.]
MRLIYLLMLALVAIPTILAPTAMAASDDDDGDEEEEIISREFSLRVGEGVKIGDYRVELISVVSVIDGLVEVRAWKRVSDFEDWRVMEDFRDANFDEGAEDGGLTLTVTEIFDEDTVRMRAEYRSDYGYPKKYVTERAMAPKNLPRLEVSSTLDRTDISAGDEVKVTITVTNAGNDTARDVLIQDSPPLPSFRYVAGYPPKIKNTLEPGETDVAVYSMVAAAEGEVEIPAAVARYSDSKSTVSSASSQSLSLTIRPERKPDLVFEVDSPGPIAFGGQGTINVTVKNVGDASAYRVEVTSEVKPDGRLEIAEGGLDESFYEIPPGGSESYTATVLGSRSGSYKIDLLASFQGDGDVLQKTAAFEVTVMEREYKFLYYLPIVPAIIIGIWLFRRYREYKY